MKREYQMNKVNRLIDLQKMNESASDKNIWIYVWTDETSLSNEYQISDSHMKTKVSV